MIPNPTHQILAPIRLPARQDAKSVRELARMAHADLPDEIVTMLGRSAHEQRPDTTTIDLTRSADGSEINGVPFLHTMRVIAPDDQKARAYVFCAPPMSWIISQRRNGLAIEDRIALAGALAECQLLATHPRWRRRGYATRLLTDAEHRYREAGYRAMFVVINAGQDDTAAWYRDRGYTIGAPDTEPMIQFWGDRMHQTGRYDHLIEGQRMGFKALNPQVTITDLGGIVHIRELLQARAVETSGS